MIKACVICGKSFDALARAKYCLACRYKIRRKQRNESSQRWKERNPDKTREIARQHMCRYLIKNRDKINAQRRNQYYQKCIKFWNQQEKMKFIQPPLKISCDGLSQKLIFELADRLVPLFKSVEVFGDKISASKPLSNHHYETAWQVLDKFGIKVT